MTLSAHAHITFHIFKMVDWKFIKKTRRKYRPRLEKTQVSYRRNFFINALVLSIFLSCPNFIEFGPVEIGAIFSRFFDRFFFSVKKQSWTISRPWKEAADVNIS